MSAAQPPFPADTLRFAPRAADGDRWAAALDFSTTDDRVAFPHPQPINPRFQNIGWYLNNRSALLLNLLLVWSFGRGMSEHVSILYWQQLIGQSYWLQCLSLLLVPVTTVIWVGMGLRRLRDWRVNVAIVSVVVLFCMCAFINYLGVFGFSWLEHVGTVPLRDNAYQLATVIEYDNYTDYYPGECDRTGYRCVFHKIYRTSALGIYEAEIQLGNNAQYLIVKIDGDIVYTNDGTQEYCSPGQGGWCADDSR